MSDFLTKLYEEEMEKVSQADLGAFMDSLSVEELAAIAGVEKLAVGGPTTPEMPTGQGHETTDKSKEKGQRDPAADVKAEEEKKAHVTKVALTGGEAALAGGGTALGLGGAYMALRKGRAGRALQAIRGLVGKGGKKATEAATKATKKKSMEAVGRTTRARVQRAIAKEPMSPTRAVTSSPQQQKLKKLREEVLGVKQSSANLKLLLEKMALAKCDAFTSPEAKAKAKVVSKAMRATKGAPPKVRKAAVRVAAKEMRKVGQAPFV
jgi:hypothetical protein